MSLLQVVLLLLGVALILRAAPPCSASISQQSNATMTYQGLQYPSGLAVFSSNRTYVADTGNHRILVSSSLASNNFSVLAQLPYEPHALAVDASGRSLYVLAPYSDAVYELDALNGTQLQAFTSAANALYLPYALAVDASRCLYVLDQYGLSKLAPNGSLIFNIDTEEMLDSNAVAVDSAGYIYITQPVVNTGNEQVAQLSSSGAFLYAFSTSNPAMGTITVLALDSLGAVYAADFSNNRVVAFSGVSTGRGKATVSFVNTSAAGLQDGSAIALSPSLNQLLVPDRDNGCVIGFSLSSRQHSVYEPYPYLAEVFAIAVDPVTGDILVGDVGMERVVRMSASGSLVRYYTTTQPSLHLGVGSLALGVDGSVYVGDSDNDRVVQFAAAGAVMRTLDLSSYQGGYATLGLAVDGSNTLYCGLHNLVLTARSGSHSQFSLLATLDASVQVTSLALDTSRSLLYVGNGASILQLKLSGAVQRIFTADSPGLQVAVALAVNAAGLLYVSDLTRVVVFDPTGVQLGQIVDSSSPYPFEIWGLALDAQARLYLVNDDSQAVLILDSSVPPSSYRLLCHYAVYSAASVITTLLLRLDNSYPIDFDTDPYDFADPFHRRCYRAINATAGSRQYFSNADMSGSPHQQLTVHGLAPVGSPDGNNNCVYLDTSPWLDGRGLSLLLSGVPVLPGATGKVAGAQLSLRYDEVSGQYLESDANVTAAAPSFSVIMPSPVSTAAAADAAGACPAVSVSRFLFCLRMANDGLYVTAIGGEITVTGPLTSLASLDGAPSPVDSALRITAVNGTRLHADLSGGGNAVLSSQRIVGVLPVNVRALGGRSQHATRVAARTPALLTCCAASLLCSRWCSCRNSTRRWRC